MQKDQQSILDIIDSIDLIFVYTQNINWHEIDIKDQDAVIRRLTIIGEATKRLSLDFRTSYPEIPWKQMAGLRDIIVHEYDDIRLDIIRDIVEIELPQILPIMQLLLTES